MTNDQHRSNIDIVVETLVDKINFDRTEDGFPRATDVTIVDNEGNTRTVKARKEVIVSGGAYCSPAILMRSGIGPKDQLSQNDIKPVVESPGVGENLLDHLIVFTFYETEKDGLTNDHLVYHDDAAMSAYQLYKEKKTGVLSTFPFGAFAYARLDERLKDSPLWQEAQKKAAPGRDPMGLTSKQPHVEYFSTELYGGPKQYDDFPIDKKHAFSLITELFSPRSKGTVRLASKDPKDNPLVNYNYLSDPLDVLVVSEGVRFANEIVMKGAGTKDIVKGSWPSKLTHHAYTKREEWIPHIQKEATTCYHAAGTCKMGLEGDRMSVLDEKLQVRGVKGLRVIDTSIMPSLHGGHTQMPAYGIGEKGADLVKEAWRKA